MTAAAESKAVLEGFHSVTPYLIVPGIARLLTFLREAFGAEETAPPMKREDGSVMHASVRIGDSLVMMGEAGGQCPPIPASLYLYVDDTDATYQRALRAGAASVMAPASR